MVVVKWRVCQSKNVAGDMVTGDALNAENGT
jgi:hypothetical protein